MAYCLNCGQRLPDDAGRCAECGAPVEGSNASTDDAGLTAEVRELALDGRKIEAIKAYRGTTGSSLAHAKEAVEAWLGGEAPITVTHGLGLNDDAKEHARSGRKIAAIKAYRDANHASLKDAKKAVEDWMRAEGIIAPSARGCATSLLAVLFVVTAVFLWR